MIKGDFGLAMQILWLNEAQWKTHKSGPGAQKTHPFLTTYDHILYYEANPCYLEAKHTLPLLLLTFFAVFSIPARETGYFPVRIAGVVAKTVVPGSAFLGTTVAVVMFIADEPVRIP